MRDTIARWEKTDKNRQVEREQERERESGVKGSVGDRGRNINRQSEMGGGGDG